MALYFFILSNQNFKIILFSLLNFCDKWLETNLSNYKAIAVKMIHI